RVLELSHGFDEEDFPGTPQELARSAASRDRTEPVLLCHLGTLHQFRRTDTLFAAIRAAAQRNPKLTERVRLVFVGNVDPANRRAIETCPVLSTMVSLLNRVPHKEALRLALDSDALLLLTGPLVWEQTGKLSEYVAMGRPILCLSHPDSSASRLVRRTGTGTVFPHGETEALTEFLVNVSADRSALGALWNPDFDEIDKLSARALTGKLAGFLEECVETAARETRRPGEP
ncbi:MAG: glycosyltransferase family 4 protein, partial [Armatimonadetes bacterium]|nr:glycosyltransferase family 4 protein [Armatimonadota bacterium]